MPGKPVERPAPAGVYTAVITPRREGESEVDLGAMLEVIDFVTARGSDGVVLFGSTGEFPHFTIEERARFIALATKRSRVPVLANVSHSTLDGSIELAEQAAAAGVAGVLIMPPYFFRYDDEAVRAFMLEFAEQVGKWTPIYLYNIPLFTNPLALSTAEQLLRSGAYAGIKDSGGDWAYLARLIEVARDSKTIVLCGHDPMYSRARRAGAHGTVSGIASATPELLCALHRAIDAGDDARAARLDSRVAELASRLARFPIPIGVREAAAARGIPAGGNACPLSPQQRLELDQFRIWFRAWIQEVLDECK